MPSKLVQGVYTAVLTPRHPDESIDATALCSLIQFQLAHGIHSFALNGATGEFPLTTPDQLRVILSAVQEVAPQAEILCGVGAPGSALAIEFASIAQQAGVKALLLPMPFFFPYAQEDVEAFSRTVAASTTLPILLYNLPQFTSGLAAETVRTLITEVPNIIGIKDSSGSLDILRDLTTHLPHACRIVGNDSALAAALTEGLCDGVVSGVACVLPELIQALYVAIPNSSEFDRTATRLDDFIDHLSPFPTPWALKWIAEARNILQATFAQPVSRSRQAQATAMKDWFTTWHPKAIASITASR